MSNELSSEREDVFNSSVVVVCSRMMDGGEDNGGKMLLLLSLAVVCFRILRYRPNGGVVDFTDGMDSNEEVWLRL